MRLEIHVRPNASRVAVGGSHDGALVVRVRQPPEHGKATTAALLAVADALEIPGNRVSLLRGATSRRKVIDIAVSCSERAALESRIQALLGGG